jgi:integrase
MKIFNRKRQRAAPAVRRHSLRAGLATAAEAEGRTVQRRLGHATAEIATSVGATASAST